jgi:DNA polymerase I
MASRSARSSVGTTSIDTTSIDREGDTLLLLDGHSLAYRAFYALPEENFSTSTGQSTNAVYGFVSMLINVLRDEHPSHVAVAFDVSRTTFRTEVYAEYKATRSASPEGFKGQVQLIKEVLDAMGILHVEKEGFEADDILATFAHQATSVGLATNIVTGDRDAFQLVSDDVTVLYPRKGMSDLARMTPAAVREKYGLTPTQYPDFAALRGDPSDNLPGIPGVGEKTAVKWITTYGSLSGLVEHANEISGKVGDALRAALPQVITNREITELRTDVAIPFDIEDLRWSTVDMAQVDPLFDALQFRVLRDRLADVAGEAPPPSAPAQEVTFDVLNSAEMSEWVERASHEPVSVQVSTTSGDPPVINIAVTQGGSVAVARVSLPSAGDFDALRDLLAGPCPLWVDDLKGSLLALADLGWDLGAVSFDVSLAAYVLQPGARTGGLAGLVERYLHRTLDAGEQDSGQLALGGDETQPEEAQVVAARALAVHELVPLMSSALAQVGGGELLTEMEIPLATVLAGMERIGIAVDELRLAELSEHFANQARAAETLAHDQVGRPFNLGSPKQLQAILFEERGLPKTKKIKTGYTTDADALQSLFARTGDPLLESILQWRDASKLRQTVDGLIPLIASDGRIHTTFQQTTTATGRLSSSDPNLQNIPIRTEEGRRIRGCFTVGEGFECLLTADYSQIEMRIMAHMSKDAGLIEAFGLGEDLHTSVAARVFDVEPESVDPEMRRKIKAMSYGLAYGLSAYGLAQQLGVEPDEARTLMNDYFDRFGGVRDFLDGIVEEARTTGFTETMLGRRRYLPDLTSDNRQRREMAERMALNAPIQGTAADIIKIAMIEVDQRLRAQGLASRMILQVHDELVCEVAPGELDTVRELVTSCMSQAVDLDVPLGVSVGVGATWEDAGHG